MPLTIRKAVATDATAIHELLEFYAQKKIVLARSVDDILYHLKNFTVAIDEQGKLSGCVAVRAFGNQLFEVRSLVVATDLQRGGVGKKMVKMAIARMQEEYEEYQLFALTLVPEFFYKLGFELVDREMFPEKIWSDCLLCPKHDCCDEIAVLYKYSR